MIQTKTIAMVLLLVIATVGAIGIGTGLQSVQGQMGGNPQPNQHAIEHACGGPGASHAEICEQGNN
jgi:hypothetical protein